MFRIVEVVIVREALVPLEKVTDWNLFESLASELMHPKYRNLLF
jgi:hypothetical protein